MGFKLIESAQTRWRAVNAPHLVVLANSRSLRTGWPASSRLLRWAGEKVMTSRSEEVTNRCLLAVLSSLRVGENIDDSEHFQEFQSALARLVPECLAESHPSPWRDESLDAFRFVWKRKVGPNDAELLGVCLLISDQTWTPFRAVLKASSTDAGLEQVELTLGETDEAGRAMMRMPYASSKLTELLFRLANRPESVDWTYSFKRRPTSRR